MATEMHRRLAEGGSGVGPGGRPDFLDRALRRQATGEAWFTDDAIRTAVTALVVGGPPQPPMAAAHALAQLLARPAALDPARAAARACDATAPRRIALEALRFNPITPAIERIAAAPHVLAAGTPRALAVPEGATVFVVPRAAMRDPRRVAEPRHFDPDRPAGDRLHFGLGLHACFGREMAEAMLRALLSPLLRRAGAAQRRARRAAQARCARGCLPPRDRAGVAAEPAGGCGRARLRGTRVPGWRQAWRRSGGAVMHRTAPHGPPRSPRPRSDTHAPQTRKRRAILDPRRTDSALAPGAAAAADARPGAASEIGGG